MSNSDHFLTLLSDTIDASEFWKLMEPCEYANRQDIFERCRELVSQHVYAGNDDAAMQITAAIESLGQHLEDKDILALSNWIYGNIYTVMGQGIKALSHYQSATAYYQELGDQLNLARMRVGVVAVLNQMGHYKEAVRVAQESWFVLVNSQWRTDGLRLAGLANNWGIACEYMGRYEEALDLYQRKIDFWQAHEDDPRSGAEVARARINIGVLKKRLNLWAEAERELEAGKQILANETTHGTYRLDLARAEMHLAHLQASQGALPERVRAAFARARALVTDLSSLLLIELLEAEWQLQSGHQLSDLLARLVKVRQHWIEMGSPRELIRVDLLLARYYAAQGDVETAVSSYRDARQAAQKIDDWEMIYLAWHGLGRVYMQANELPSASHAFELAVTVVEQIREEITATDWRSWFLEDKLAVYRDLTALHMARADIHQAFHWSERARERELVEMLSRENGHPPALSPKRKGLTDKIATVAEVCTALPEDALLLIFVMDKTRAWIFPLTAAGCLEPRSTETIPSAAAIEQALSWVSNLAQYSDTLVRRHGDMLIAAAQRPLADLYTRLLAPIADLLASYQQLIIVPDGPLYGLPFHAFFNGRLGRYLVETHKVSQALSATAWLLGQQYQPEGAGGVALAYGGRHLQHTEAEVQAVVATCPGFVAYQEAEATCDLLRSQEVSQAEFVHLASHAVFRGDNPLFSYIELADGRLEACDVLGLKLNAQLVVLSACETGLGLLKGGEYLGLARAFLLAGAHSVVASHWPVNDAITAQFMTVFYRHLAAGLQPGTALRQAQLAALSADKRCYRHPFYWAPFFLLGSESVHLANSPKLPSLSS